MLGHNEALCPQTKRVILPVSSASVPADSFYPQHIPPDLPTFSKAEKQIRSLARLRGILTRSNCPSSWRCSNHPCDSVAQGLG